MNKTRTVAAAAAGALGAGALGAGLFTLPASAQATLGPWSVAPGDSFTVSGGDPCLPDDPDADPAPTMTVAILIDDPAITPDVEGVPVSEDGSWSATVTVAENEAPGTYSVGARCLADGVAVADPDVGNGDLMVEQDGGTTTTEPSTTSTTSGGGQTPTTSEPGDDGDDGDDEPGPPPGGDDGGDNGDDDGGDEGPQPGEPAPEVNGDADYTG